MAEAATEFVGTERFSLRRKLGAGGMGVVYEAHDCQINKTVALKTLNRAEADHIYRFKREFRTLADVSHPNLAELYELMSEDHHWFFTMELIKGVTFIQYVRPDVEGELIDEHWLGSRIQDRADSEAETEEFDSSDISLESGEMMAFTDDDALPLLTSPYKLNEARLRSALRQLAEGLHHLHEKGKLHRDIKPSNVLVTNDGRVVILDFGLVEDVEPEMRDTLLVGTPDYMSPEQGAQLPISKASDWYSVGVILYEALTGRLPFTGKFFEIVLRKQTRRPIQPIELNPNAPRDLNDLCMKLLRRNPRNRPTGPEILTALSGGRTPVTTLPIATPASEISFVGRERQLADLHDAFRATRKGQTISVYLRGLSGMGKSTLVRTFLEQAKEGLAKTIVLQGRCYERESVPYKALDGVVDNLSKHLASIRRATAEALMPRNASALARLFPVMLQVDAIFEERSAQHETGDLFTLRRQAFGALRELLTAAARRWPLIIWIDDLQWADSDSILLLEDLLRPPDGPPLLLICSFRAEDVESKPFLKQLVQNADGESCRELFLNPLTGQEASNLAHSLFNSSAIDSEPFIDSIVHEAAGNPFLLEQLSHYAMMSERATAGTTLTTMLEERIRQLPKGSRQILDTLAVAGRPVNQDVAFSAAGIEADDLGILNALRAAQFVRSGGSAYAVELYHHRIGETLRLLLPDHERQQIHRRLAQAIEARGFDDPEGLYQDYLGAGENSRAAFHAEAAARKAASALAFDRAALYFRRAIELAPADTNIVELKIALGDALANAGRPAEAAAEFLEAAKTTSSRRALELRQRAGAQLLMGGHLAEGLEVFETVLRATGLKMPKGPKRALLSLIMRRWWVWLRGLDFTEREAAVIPEADLQRIDVCWSVAAGLGIVDLIRGAEFQSRHLLLALRAGEVYRVARAMAFETVQTATRGGKAIPRARELAERTEALAQRAGHPHATGMAIWARGLSAYLIGSWKEAAELCDRAAEVLRDQCTGATWELTVANRFMLTSLMFLGELTEVSRRVPQLLTAAIEQGNLIAATDLRTRLNPIWLAADDPDRARNEVISAMMVWPREGFHLQHYTSLVALAQIELYTGDTEVAWKHIESQLKPMEKSLLLRTQGLRIDALHLRARLALASSAERERERRLRIAAVSADRIARENMAWSNPLATLIHAALATQHGDLSRAAALTSEAIKGFEAADMALYAAAARRRLGEILGGDQGRELIAQADKWMSKQQIKNPSAVTNLMAPGFSLR
jgi:serine/threonine protein kinase/tetratricopeptide (TPR) repeat protein